MKDWTEDAFPDGDSRPYRLYPPCVINGCEAEGSAAKGLCWPHYQRDRRSRIKSPREDGKCLYYPCGRPAKRRGLCDSHAQQYYRGQILRPLAKHDPRESICSFAGCPMPVKVRNLCDAHYSQWRRGVELHPVNLSLARENPVPGGLQRDRICIGPKCDRPAMLKDMCRSHYQQWNRHGKLFVLERRSKRAEA